LRFGFERHRRAHYSVQRGRPKAVMPYSVICTVIFSLSNWRNFITLTPTERSESGAGALSRWLLPRFQTNSHRVKDREKERKYL
jgi:hypothetical protein